MVTPKTVVLTIGGTVDCESHPQPWESGGDDAIGEHRLPELQVAIDVYDDGRAKVRLPGYPTNLGTEGIVLEAVSAFRTPAVALSVRIDPPAAPARSRTVRVVRPKTRSTSKARR